MATEESALVAAWYRGAPWLWLLRPLEFIFRGLTAVRRAFYQWGLLPSYRSPVPLVVVGNITVGGTGKTPVVLALIEHLQSEGIRAGMVSRGYGASAGSFPHSVDAQSSARDCGDEALLIYARTGCPCVVGPDRSAAVRQLLTQFQVDVIVSDDGLQHYAMARDIEIAVLDQYRGIGNGFCLPAGPLREPASRLKRVDSQLVRGGDEPATAVRYQPVSLVELSSGKECPVSPQALQQQVHAVAGIGQPDQFFDTLTEHGFELERHVYPDHHMYSAQELAGLSDKPVIMTEKDAVKCRQFDNRNYWYLKINALIPGQVLQRVVQLVRGAQET
jgi:tetraacyldisaccharide 4'-kinase